MNANKRAVVKAVDALNFAFDSDPTAIWTLMNAYTKCNEELAEHPTIQVIESEKEGQKGYAVGPLGLLNGVIEAMTGEKICIRLSEPNEDGKRKLLGFDIVVPEKQAIITQDKELILP